MDQQNISLISEKKNRRIRYLAGALILCAALFCTAFSLSGCKPPPGQLAANAAIAEMSAIEKQNPESISYLPEVSQARMLDAIGVSEQEFFAWWLEGFTYSLGDVELNVDEDRGDINAKITCRQLESIIKQWSGDYVEWLVSNGQAIESGQTEDPCEYGKLLLESYFQTTEPVLVETTVTVQKYDDAWSVIGDESNGLYRDALLGSTDNLLGYYETPLAELAALGVNVE